TLAQLPLARHDRTEEDDPMSAQVIVGKAIYTIPGADHLQVDGDLVQIQRSSPSGFETLAVAGEDLLVTIEPALCARVLVRAPRSDRRGEAALTPEPAPRATAA